MRLSVYPKSRCQEAKEMKLNTLNIGLVLLVFLLGITVFSIFSKAQFKEPEVVVLGNPSKMDQNLRAKLPAGYSWRSGFDEVSREELLVEDGDVTISPYSDVPWIVVSLSKDTDWKSILQFARDTNKETIYVLPNIVDPNIPVAPFNPTLEGLLTEMENFIITPVFADNVPAINCTTGSTVPATTCYTIFPVDDFPDDGLTPSLNICYQYATKTCHTTPMTTHLRNNIFWSGPHNHDDPVAVPVSFARCMKGHNGGPTFLKFPINLTVNLYPSDAAAGSASGCIVPVCGCAQIGSLSSTPRESIGKTIWLSTPCDRNNWGAVRHETGHTYAYSHCNMDQNFESVAHCINGRKEIGSCNSVFQNLPPVHIAY
jgi:hypothetical protein